MQLPKWSSGIGKRQMDFIRAKKAEIEGAESSVLAGLGSVQNRAFSIAYLTIIIGGVISLVVSILMGVLLTRGIAIPLARMTSAMTALAKGRYHC